MKYLMVIVALTMVSLGLFASDATASCSHSWNQLVATSYEIGRIEASYEEKLGSQLRELYEKREKFAQEVKACSGIESFYSCDHTKPCDTGAE